VSKRKYFVMPTSGIRIVSETNLSSYGAAHSLKGDIDLSSSNIDYDNLVPVTLNNVLIMENIEPEPAVATKTFVNLDTKNFAGGFSTIVTPSSETPVFAEIQSNMVPRRTGGRRIKEEELSPEEEEKLRQRRERNKQAAARCRKRRVDQTTSLQNEVDIWEEKKRLLQEEIHALQSQREELQFILDAHKNVCNRQSKPVTNNNPTRSHVLNVPTAPKVIVKTEVPSMVDNSATFQHHLTHEEALNMPTSTTTSIGLTPSFSTSRPMRPATLSLAIKPQNLRSIEGIPIETPTNVFNSLNFDALMEGRTGLTPTNVLTPVNISMSLQTPVSSTPNCGTQQRNNDILSPESKPKLVSL